METPSKFPVSYSRLSTFEQCELKFDYLYVSKTVVDQGSPATREGTRVHEALEKYGKGEADMPRDLQKHKALVDRILLQPGEKHFELQFALTADKKVTGWYDADVWLRAIVDVLVVDGEKAVVIDWKTGKRRPNMTQLQLFAAVVMTVYPAITQVKAAFAWLKTGEMDWSVMTRDMLPQLWKGLEARLTNVQEAVDNGYFEPKPGYMCKWCPARKNCVYAK